ncbi:MAG: thymidylate synthase [Geitlerinemataceae cyanobacterium]
MTVTPSSIEFKYNALYKPNQLVCGTGQTCVVTGWTVKAVVAKQLQPEEFAAIGNLYSPTRGMNFLIRNLLANPHVRHLVVLNGTREDRNSGGGKCLLDFFRHGFDAGKSDTGRDCWVVKSEIPGFIDREVEAAALDRLREAIEFREATSVADAISQIQSLAQKNAPPWGKSQTFPLAEIVPTVLPGPRYGHRIEGRTIAETWVKIIHRIKTTGTIRPTGYDGKWQELIDLVAVVTDEPEDFYFPEPNYLPLDRTFLEEYIGQILDDAPQREGVKYTYGQRLRSHFERDQIEQVIEKLIGEIDAASAVMSLWDVKDHDKGGSPCLNHIWVRVVDNELSLTALFRSNDMFAAWPANAMGLRALQQHIRDKIEARSQYQLKLGPLITISQSAHIYDDCHEHVELVLEKHYSNIVKARNYNDPCGNFIISLSDRKIKVEQTTPGSGESVQCFQGGTAVELYREIAQAIPQLEAEHAMYLGTELQKAEIALKKGWLYEQDRSIL